MHLNVKLNLCSLVVLHFFFDPLLKQWILLKELVHMVCVCVCVCMEGSRRVVEGSREKADGFSSCDFFFFFFSFCEFSGFFQR